MADTVRTIDDLLAVLFVSGQPDRSITEQDMRDLIVSISLETADLSALPRSTNGLNIGRLWIDGAKALRMVSTAQPRIIGITDAGKHIGAGSLTADARVVGRANVFSASATLAGAGGVTLTPRPPIYGVTTTDAATGSLGANAAMRQSAKAQFSGSGDLSPTTRLLRRATALMPGSGSISGDATATSGQKWGTVNSNITKSNANLTITRSANTGVWGAAKPAQFKTSGKWYWEVHIDTYTNVHLGIGNNSVSTTDGVDLGGDTNSFQYYTFGGAGGVVINGAWQASPDPFGAGSVVSFALDMANGWWARVNGGTWAGFNGGSGDPATNNNPIPISLIVTTGGLGPVASLAWVSDALTLRTSSASWSFSAPAGFSQM